MGDMEDSSYLSHLFELPLSDYQHGQEPRTSHDALPAAPQIVVYQLCWDPHSNFHASF